MQDVAEEVIQIHKAMGAGVDISFDCAGFNKTMSTALNVTRPGGKVCLVGLGHNEMTVPLTSAAVRYDSRSIHRRTTFPWKKKKSLGYQPLLL